MAALEIFEPEGGGGGTPIHYLYGYVLFNAFKFLSPIQLSEQYGLSFTNFLFQTITTCFEIVCIDGLGI